MTGYHEFSRYLLEVEDIPEKRIRYYVRWVRKYHYFKKITPYMNLHLEEFLESLSKNSPPWMVRQAEHAIRLYMIFTQRTANPKNESGAETRTSQIELSRRHESPWDTIEQQYIECIRLRGLSLRTEKSYRGWFSRFRMMHTETAPEKVTEKHLKMFLTALAVERKVSKSTQRVAFNALLFLYKYVLKKPITSLKDVIAASGPRRLPVVLTREEITRIFSFLNGAALLAAEIIYGCGLRLTECLSLYLMPWKRSIRTPGRNGDGSGYSPLTRYLPIHEVVSPDGITCIPITPWPFEYQYNHDLHSCRQKQYAGCTEPIGSVCDMILHYHP